jgi:chloramphenicol-sensitive protein RarD
MEKQVIRPLGYVLTFLAYFIWGIMPIYWKLLNPVDPREVLFHRLLWTFIFLSIISLFKYKRYLCDLLRDKHKRKLLLFSSLCLGTNWALFIYAISINRILDASLGYYINPLVSVMLGVVLLKEKLPRLQIIAVILAIIGVGYMTVNYGRLPVISLTLAISFGLYALMKKTLRVEPIPALLIETGLLLPLFFGFFYFSIQNSESISFLSTSMNIDVLLILSGIATVIPLTLFGKGASLIPLKSTGFLQFITPTFMLLIGTVMYNEPFTMTHIVSFGLIWAALAVYSCSLFIPTYGEKRVKSCSKP